MVKRECIFTKEITVTYKKDTVKKMSYVDYIICENLQYLQLAQKLLIIHEIVNEAKTNLSFDEIIKHLSGKSENKEIS
ncbi:MAG: hypothetical protein IJ532_04155 [Alphaproteobacteria bacterium]|nr:hypothetical protein [Alphaproteobacteria bacterium]